MPEKSLGERLRRAKRQGRPVAVKEGELLGGTRKSAHAEKRSQGLGQFEVPADRHASPRKPPGRGHSGRKALKSGRTAAYVKQEERDARPRNRKGKPQKLGGNTNLPDGRKKAPSELNVKRKGGPAIRSPLHGG